MAPMRHAHRLSLKGVGPQPHQAVMASRLVVGLVVGLAACGETPAQPLASSASAPAVAESAAAVPPAGSSTPQPANTLALPVDPVPWVGIPKTVEEVEKVINPNGDKPYAGKTGTLKGKITIKGDPPPEVKLEFPKECEPARATYGKLFRVGEGGALADALVAVTGYEGFVPVEKPLVPVSMKGCAFDQTSYSVTFGQRLEVKNIDTDPRVSHVPILDPAPFRSLGVALPQGNAVKLYAYQPAVNYVLRDYTSKPFLTARVFVLKFATHDVSGLDGTYEIKNIPVGRVDVNAFLPALQNDATKKTIDIKEGDNTLDIELTYDSKKDKVAEIFGDPWTRPSPSTETPSGSFGHPPKLPPKNDAPR
jgi:hypothetical protein